MPLLNKRRIPPGGYIYEQFGSDSQVLKKFKTMNGFGEIVSEVLKFRQLNKLPRATSEEVSEDVDEAQCRRLGYSPLFCDSKKNSPYNPIRLFKAAAGHLYESVAAGRIGQLDAGRRILVEWLGDGAKSVTYPEAQHRADICCGRGGGGNRCPFNQGGFKPIESVAKMIKDHVEKKNEMSLAVEHESELHTCAICWCHLPLKVWVPMAHILDNTPNPMILKFKSEAPWCWMLQNEKATA